MKKEEEEEEEQKTIEERDRIYLDKIKAARVILEYEFKLISEFESLFRRLSSREITVSDLEDDGDYYIIWQMIFQLYALFEYNQQILTKLKSLSEKEYERINVIVKKYRAIDKKLDFSEMQFMYNKVRQIMELAGYHDMTSGKVKDFMKPTQDHWEDGNFKDG